MSEIIVHHPQNNETIHGETVMASGRYDKAKRIKGTLSSLTGNEVYAGQLQVLKKDLWVLFFDYVKKGSYVLHLFDTKYPTALVPPISLKVLPPAFASLQTRIVSPATGDTLFDRNFAAGGTSTAPEITLAEMRHAGFAAISAHESMPVAVVNRIWAVSFSIPTTHPCPGNSPDYTIHVESSVAPNPENNEIKLDKGTLCPDKIEKSMKKKKKKQKKKAKGKK